MSYYVTVAAEILEILETIVGSEAMRCSAAWVAALVRFLRDAWHRIGQGFNDSVLVAVEDNER